MPRLCKTLKQNLNNLKLHSRIKMRRARLWSLSSDICLAPMLHPGTSISNALSSIYHPQPEGQTACGISKCRNGCVTGLVAGQVWVNRIQVAEISKISFISTCAKKEKKKREREGGGGPWLREKNVFKERCWSWKAHTQWTDWLRGQREGKRKKTAAVFCVESH